MLNIYVFFNDVIKYVIVMFCFINIQTGFKFHAAHVTLDITFPLLLV